MENNLFNNPYLSDLVFLQRLAIQNPNELQQLLKNIQVTQLESIPDNRGYAYGGRIGYAVPVDSGLFRAGITGQGFNMGQNKDFDISGGDIGYATKDRDLSLSYKKQSEYGPNLIQLLFKQYF